MKITLEYLGGPTIITRALKSDPHRTFTGPERWQCDKDSVGHHWREGPQAKEYRQLLEAGKVYSPQEHAAKMQPSCHLD